MQTLREMDGVAKAGAVREAIVAAMVAAKEPINETIQSGAPKYQNDIRWARMYLVNAGMLERSEVSGRGTWKLTPAGWSTKLDESAVVAIYFKSEGKNGAPPTESKVVPSDDGLQKDLTGLNSWESQLKKLLTKMPDKGFERLCAETMTKNGLHSTKVTGSTGDQGIDGEGFFAIDALKLISVKVAWQCKRFAAGNKVAPDEIRDFRGAMAADTDYGLFFTTSFFTTGALADAGTATSPDRPTGIRLTSAGRCLTNKRSHQETR